MTPAAQAPDLLFATYLLWGAVKGWRRRFGRELQGLLKLLLLLAWLWGFGVFRWLRDALGGLLQSHPVTHGMLGALLAIVAAMVLIHLLRDRLASVLESRMSPVGARGGGAITGLLRTALWGGALLLLVMQLPWIGETIAGSFSGHWLERLTG